MKRALQFLVLMACLIVPWTMKAQETVVIGDSTTTTTTYYGPFNSLWGYSFVEQIYLADEIDMEGNITSISFYLNASSAALNNHIVLYMKNVTKSSFTDNTDWETVTADDIVFEGTWNAGGDAGWLTIELDEPFAYEGGNLLVAMHENTSGYSTRYFKSTPGTNMLISAHSDSADPDPYNIAAFTGTKYTQNVRNVIQLEITPMGDYCAKPSNMTVSDLTAHEATFSWESEVGDYIFEYKPAAATDEEWEEISTSDNTVTIDGLFSNTVYNARVKAICGDENESGYRTMNFTTLISCPAVTAAHTTNVTSHGATIEWTAGGTEESWIVVVDNNVDDAEMVDENTVTIDDLLPVTSHVVSIRAYCEEEDTSTAVTVNFTTLVSCPAITNLHTTSVMSYSATFGWTVGSEEEAWLVYADGDEDGVMVEEPTFELTDLEPATPHTIVVRAYCGEGDTSTSVSASCTTMVACPAPINITAELTISDPTIATINWVQPSDATAWQICFNNNMDELIEVEGDPTYFFEGLTPEVQDTVKIRAICSDEDTSAWSNEFIFTPSVKVIIGAGTAVNSYLPTYSLYKYGLTQQIYTSAELGEAGLIMSVDFYNNGTEKTRNLDIYMVNSTKESFTGTTDWVIVSAANKVFSGNVTFTAGAWTTITFDTPFAYDGTSNVVFVVDDNTGSWSSGLSCRVFDAPAQAIRQYSDSQNNDPFAPAYAGAVLDVKNQVRLIKVAMDGCIMPNSLELDEIASTEATISWQAFSEDQDTWIVRANNGEWIEVNETTYTFTDLNPSSDYEFFVATYCGYDDTSLVISVTGHTPDLCNALNGLTLTNYTSDSAYFTWTAGTNTEWGYEYGPVGYEEGEGISGTVEENHLDIGELEAGTAYVFYVWTICEQGPGPRASKTFITHGLPISEFPYSTGFEVGDDMAWEFVNGGNAWYIDTAVHMTGSRGLYISNDNGASNSYSGSIAMSYAYRTITINDAGEYYISFDWKVKGEGNANYNYDYMRAWLAPSTANFTANQLPDGTNTTSAYAASTPTGWIDLGGTMNQNETWQTSDNFVNLTAGNYVLVFMWCNDGSVYNQPAAAVDNVQIALNTCSRPAAIVADNISGTSLSFHWSPAGEENLWELTFGDNDPIVTNDTNYTATGLTGLTNYTIRVRAICGEGDTSVYLNRTLRTSCTAVAELPYVENFESYGTGATESISPCWTKGTNSTTAYPYPYSTAAIQGNRGLYFYSSYPTYYSYAALPAFETPINQLMVEFKMKRYNSTSTAYTSRIVVGVMTDPSNIETFEPIETFDMYAAAGNTVQTMRAYFNGYTGNGQYIAFYDAAPPLYGTNTSSYSYVYLDSVAVSLAPDCVPPMGLTVETATANTISVSILGVPDETYRYSIVGTSAGATPTSVDVAATNYTFTGLQPHTPYIVTVAGVCDGVLTDSSSINAMTTYLGVDLPYITGFEDDDAEGWTILNGTSVNQWTVGTAVNNGGSKALYISQDSSASNTYNIESISNAIAFKTFNINEPGQYGVSFDWHNVGEDEWDYMRAFLVPGSVDIVAGTNGIDSTNLPTGWIAVDGGKYLSQSAEWRSSVKTFNVTYPGVYHLLFFWHNDNNTGEQPAAAVDNVIFKQITCPTPTAFVLDSISSSTASFHWTAGGQETMWAVGVGENDPVTVTETSYTATGLNPATHYQVRIYALCGGDDTSFALTANITTECAPYPVPFYNDFENEPSGHFNPICWNNSHIEYSSNVYPRVTTLTGNPNDRLVMMYHGAYLVLPEIAVPLSGLELGLNWQTSGDSNYIVIAYLDSANQLITDMTVIDTLYKCDYPTADLSSLVYRLLNDVPADAKHLVLKCAESGTSSYDFLGFISIDVPRTCITVDSIALTAATESSATLTWQAPSMGNTPAGYEVEYGPRMFQHGDGTTAVVTTNSITINNLNPIAPYDIYVRSICGEGDTSDWSLAFEFSTECAPLNVPAVYGFDEFAVVGSTYGERLPNCWVTDSAAVTTTTYKLPTMYNNSSDIQLYMEAANSIVALPEMTEPLDTLSLRVKFRTTGSYYALVVGVVTNNTQGFSSTFVPIDTLQSASTTVSEWAEVYIATADIPEGYIALKNIYLGTTTYAYVYIDSVIVDYGPTCYPVLNIHPVAATGNSVTVDWDDIVSADNWSIEYGPTGFTPGNGITMTATEHPVTIEGLENSTKYDVYVTPLCSADDHGATRMGSMRTDMCDDLTIAQNFTDGATSTTSSYAPIGTSLYNYSYVQTIIDSADLAEIQGDITALAFLPASTNKGDYYNHVDVYMANVSDTVLTSGFILPTADHPFVQVITDGDFRYTTTDWQIQVLDQNFTWDGHSNVLVAVHRQHGSWSSGGSFVAYTRPTNSKKVRYIQQDSGPYNINTVTGGTATNTVGALRLYSCNGPSCHVPVITGTEVTETSVTVNFTGDASEYEVVIMEGAWGEPTTGIVSTTANTYTFIGLNPMTQYTVGVRALCEDDLNSTWVSQMVTTLELVCPAPSTVVVSDVTMTGATIGWTIVDEAQTAWEVNVTGLNYDQTFTATTNLYTLTGLTAGVEYTVKVRAICGDGYSEWSTSATFTTGICEAVSNVTVSNVTTNSATVAWTAAEGQTSWQLDYGPQGHPQGTGTTVVVNTNPYTLTGLEEYTPYDVYVRTICADGVFSDWSIKANFTTLQTEGIEGVNSDLVKLYPNPASTTVTISGISGEATVSVVDMNGRTVYSERANETLTIDLTGYAQGAYFVRISGEQTMAIRKLIVK